MKDKKQLPYTLAKAKEKANEKYKQVQNKPSNSKLINFSSGMQWDLLPKEILDQLGINKSNCLSEKDENSKPCNSLINSHDVESSPGVFSDNERRGSKTLGKENVHGRKTCTPVISMTPDMQLEYRSSSTSKNLKNSNDHVLARKVSFKDEPETIPSILLESTACDDDTLTIKSTVCFYYHLFLL